MVMEIVMFVQFAVIERLESIMEQPVVTDVKASSGEVFERTTHIHVGKLNVQMTFFSFFSFFFVLFVDLYMQP